jgi:hypothetical protein
VKLLQPLPPRLEFIEELYKVVEKNVDPSEIDRQKLSDIHKKYQKMR